MRSITVSTSLLTLCLGASDVFPAHPEDGVPRSFWRLPCRGQSGIGRVDPIVSPGNVSAHVHVLYGSGGLGLSATVDDLKSSPCTSCAVIQDRSAYWTPTLNFVHQNGTTQMVPQAGGLLVYYKSFADTVPFPDGFRMTAGDPFVRNFSGPFPDVASSDAAVWNSDPTVIGSPAQQFFLMQRAIGFNCLNYARPPEPSLWRHTLPPKNIIDAECVDGLRLELAFPSCGNGHQDSDDHQSHMAYPSLVQLGTCPIDHPVRYPLLFFETIYMTSVYKGLQGEFVLSNGDPIGTGYHGDFMMGWNPRDVLSAAMVSCRSMSGEVAECPLFNLQDDDAQMQCRFPTPPALQSEDAVGPREGLAGTVPIQSGPAPAIP